MPIYEYVCKACGRELEDWQKISDKPLRKCPKCSAFKLERVVSRTSFQLKGDGWYVTGGYGAKKDGKDKASGTNGDSAATSTPPTPPAKEAKPAKAAPSSSTCEA